MNRKNLIAFLSIYAFLFVSFSGCTTTSESFENVEETTETFQPALTENPDNAEMRAVWVSVLGPGLRTEQEVRDMVDAVRRANLNVIIAQVRREGATIYPSDIEPRHAIVRDTPDFDPLELLLELAHDTTGGKNRIDVHAWFNIFKLGDQEDYVDAELPAIGIAHPEWFTRDFEGEVHTELDPGVPAVQEHTVKVIEECLNLYDVDGVNLDFIRYFGKDRGYNPIALERFHNQTGRDDRPAVDDPQWDIFRREQVSAMVRQVAATTWTMQPDATFSVDATAFGGPGDSWETSAPYIQVFQDWSGWAEKGWVDWVARMGYKREHTHADQFRDWADYSRALMDRSNGVIITLGIGGYFNSMEGALTQYREAQARNLGTSLFSYNRPTREAREGPGAAESPFWDTLGTQIYSEPVPPPRPIWRNEYAVLGVVVNDEHSKPLDNVLVSLKKPLSGDDSYTLSAKTDGNGLAFFSKLPPGEWLLLGPSQQPPLAVSAPAGKVTWTRMIDTQQQE